jgi:hypothetical protein
MSFATPDRPREVRMDAAYFLQQLCQSRYSVVSLCCYYRFSSSLSLLKWGLEFTLEASFLCSSLTLQMFIACRGIPVLVGFLEADYAKYRFVVVFAMDETIYVLELYLVKYISADHFGLKVKVLQKWHK